MNAKPRGRFITFEGIDGAGKSTQIALLADALRARGREVLRTREPGGTELGEKLRGLLLGMDMHPDTEAMLMFAARREHLAAVIAPALAAGVWVLSDRFSDATHAYQVGGRGLAAARCDALEAWVHPGFAPDLTFLLDMPLESAAARLAAAGAAPDRFEREQHGFFARVRAAYLDRARREPARFRVLDATREPETIAAEVTAGIDEKTWQ
ncbi:MAG: dTMP kinase [Azoarcus sp.]|jgi:dTMP kinase|nr:dTMP kinase [Azoarcus sp.]